MNPVASAEGIASLIPNRPGLELITRAAGFARVEWCEPTAHHTAPHRLGDRGQLVAYT